MLTEAQLATHVERLQKNPVIADMMARGINWQTILQMIIAILISLGILPPIPMPATASKTEEKDKNGE